MNWKILTLSGVAGLLGCAVHAQDLKYYRYDTDRLPKEFHTSRRQALREQMPANSAAVLFAAPERNRSNDNDYEYHPSPNFYYLTGFEEPNAVLLIYKSPHTVGGLTADEFLFVPDRNPSKESWNGRRAGKEGPAELTGIKGVFLAASFDNLSFGFDSLASLWYSLPKGVIDDPADSDDLYNLVESFKKKSSYPPANGDNGRLISTLAALRMIKAPEEIVLLRKAISMSCEGHNEIMRALAPGFFEYEVQAIGEYVFKRNGSEYVGYPSICGGGENSCILHYNTNRRPLQAGDLQLNDMGAEYHGYTADVTRTLPVSGKFSAEQRQIYELVLHAQEAGMEACLPGNNFRAAHEAAQEVIMKGLTDLGIIKDPRDYRKYFNHGTSHYLGLDVHDAGNYEKLKPGVVMTVEPGIYIPEGSPCDPKWWNIGIRIEDDILITDHGYENLSAAAPRTPDEIEAMMREKPKFLREK